MRRAGKYEPLYDYLRRSGKNQIAISFAEIESLLGNKLPQSAHEKGWWSNRKNALQASAWMEAGYEVLNLDLVKQRVTFSKLKPHDLIQRDKSGAIVWDANAIKALRMHMGLTQAQFADELGVRQQTVSEWEQGVYAPTRATSKHLLLVAEQTNFELIR